MYKAISTDLKKRTFFDMILSCLLCAGALTAAIWQLIIFLNTRSAVYIGNAVYSCVIFAELGLLSLILLEIRKTGKPFSKQIIAKLRIMAVVLMAGGLVPRFTEVKLDEFSQDLAVSFDMTNLLVIFLGVIIGIVSEIFVYGMSLQEDNDLIA